MGWKSDLWLKWTVCAVRVFRKEWICGEYIVTAHVFMCLALCINPSINLTENVQFGLTRKRAATVRNVSYLDFFKLIFYKTDSGHFNTSTQDDILEWTIYWDFHNSLNPMSILTIVHSSMMRIFCCWAGWFSNHLPGWTSWKFAKISILLHNKKLIFIQVS